MKRGNLGCRHRGCTRPVKVVARRLCNAHYLRLQRSGPLAALPPVNLFWPQVDKSGDCWLWTGHRNTSGYGSYGGRGAHRLAWEYVNGPITDGMTIDHRCRVRACVRPHHLRLMTLSSNQSDNGFRDREACSNGHEYTPENTRVRVRHGRSTRVCRACDRDRQAGYQRRLKVARRAA